VTDDSRRQFADEAEAWIEELETALDASGDPTPGRVNGMFRAAHSFKSAAAMEGFRNLGAFLHDLESALDELRMGRSRWNSSFRAALRQAVSRVARELRASFESGGDASFDAASAGRALRQAVAEAAATDAFRPPPLDLDERTRKSLTEYEEHRLAENLRAGRHVYAVSVVFAFADFDERLRRLGERMNAAGELLATLPSAEGSSGDRLAFRLLYSADASPIGWEDLAPGLSIRQLDPEAPFRRGAEEPGESIRSAGRALRVPLERVDAVLGRAEETSRAAERVVRRLRGLGETLSPRRRYELEDDLAKLLRSVREVRESAVRTRLVPVRTVAVRLARVADRLLAESGKEAGFSIEGGETEIDRPLLEELADPLLHILNNAVDHGLEEPAERLRLGKPRRGSLRFIASARGASATLAIADDGRGIDEALIRDRARELGYSDPGPAAPRARVLDLLFEPGFSTASEVSATSGRGVGLDVVRERVHALRGEIRVFSERGRGTRFELNAPVTLALYEVLLVEDAGRLYAVPMGAIQRTAKLEEGQTRLVLDEGACEVLSLASALRAPASARRSRFALLLPPSSGPTRAIGVERILRDRSVVVRPIPPPFDADPSLIGLADFEESGPVLVVDPARLEALRVRSNA
jgi:two-component system, chemotaxis family, sensor kinase CheA